MRVLGFRFHILFLNLVKCVNNGNSGRSFERPELAAINATIIQLENEANRIRSGHPGVLIRGTVVST